MPELITVCWANGKPYQAIYGTQSEMEIFNPIEPRVYATMEELLREIKNRFPSNYIHLGKSDKDNRTKCINLSSVLNVIFEVWMKFLINVGKFLVDIEIRSIDVFKAFKSEYFAMDERQ